MDSNSPIYILCIETSTNVCSVCVSENGTVKSLRETADFKSHTEKITIYIQECLEEAKLTLKDISAIAIASGPGSYTGLRIGASTAKGLCYGLDIPLITINSLVALAQGVSKQIQDPDLIVSAIDARRSEVYAMVFDAQFNTLLETTSVVLDQDNILLRDFPDKTFYCIGNGADKCKTLLPYNIVVIGDKSSAKYMGKISFDKWQKADFNDIVSFSPFYFKNPNITLTKKKPL